MENNKQTNKSLKNKACSTLFDLFLSIPT